MKNIFATLLALLLFQNVFSQENYLAGYIVQLNGDTTKGFIDYRNWNRNPDNIFFKQQLSGSITNYTPLTIKEFHVADEIYKSAIIQTEVSSYSLNKLKYDTKLNFKTDTTFLQTMIQGEKSLYYYMNDFEKEQFYIKSDTGYDLLIYKKYLKADLGRPMIIENNKYLGQLSLYLMNCASIRSKLESVEYSKKSLESAFVSYYDCVKSNINFQKETEKSITETGVLAGSSITKLNFESASFSGLVNAKFKPTVSFSAGLFLNAAYPRIFGRFSLINDLVFTSYKVKASFYDRYLNENEFVSNEIKLEYVYLILNNQIRFRYPIGKTLIFVSGGVSNGFAIREINYSKNEQKSYSIDRIYETKALPETRKYEQGYILGGGLQYQKISFQMRYERGGGMSVYPALKSITKRYYFFLGYNF